MTITLDQIHDVIDERTLALLERRGNTNRVRARGWLVRRALLAADLASLIASFLLAERIYGVGPHGAGHLSQWGEHFLFALSLPAFVIAAKLYGLYDKDEERTDHSTTDDFAGVFHLVTVVVWLCFAAAYWLPLADPEFPKIFVFWLCAVTTIPLARVGARAYCRRQIGYLQNTVIVGAGDIGQSLARRLLKHPEYGLNLVGFVDEMPKERLPELEHLALLGTLADLPQLVGLLDVERVIVAFSNDGHAELLDLARDLNDINVQVDIVPRLFEVVGPGVGLHTIEGVPVIGLPPLRLSRSSRLLKRAVDTSIATMAMLALSPFLIVVALFIKADSPGPVFFRQIRAGRKDDLFRIWKFRTMVVDAEERKDDVRHLSVHALPGGDTRMFKVHNDPRITRVGKLLRRYSIDELPQLLNVLAGEMSLVGPRPLILEEDRYVEDWGRRRLDLKPGMTGLWQVLGRSDIPFSEMVRLDYLYVTGWSLMSDLRLILRTIPILFGSRNA